VQYRAENLPEGIILNGDGSFSGIPAAAGSYDAVIHATAQITRQGGDGPFSVSSNQVQTTEYIIHVVIEIAE